MGSGEPGVGLFQEATMTAVAMLQMVRFVRVVGVVLHGHREPGRQGDDGQHEPEDAGGKDAPEAHA